MKMSVLLAVVCVVVASARHHGGGGFHHGGGISTAARACFELLLPRAEKETLEDIVEGCINSTGVGTILDTIFRPRRHHRRDPAQALEDNGYTAEALALRTCIANGQGFVAANGTFDEAALRDSIVAKVNGTNYATNVQAGLNNCPTTGFVAFETREFFKCLLSYCATGAAPA